MLTDAELRALYERYGYLVHRRCLALLCDGADADDGLQETFLRLQRFSRVRSFEVTGALLYKMASNCCFDLMKRRREQPLEAGARERPAADDPDRRAVMADLLSRLDDKTREIGVLHHLDGFTQEEVAARTGYSRRTIGKKLQRFEALLRELWTSPEPAR